MLTELLYQSCFKNKLLNKFLPFINHKVSTSLIFNLGYRVKRPLLARVPSLARFVDNLTEITRVKECVVEFFFTEAVNTVV